MAGCNFSARDLPSGPSVLSLVFEAWPFQGETGVVVVDIGAHRTEFEISAPVEQTVDIAFDHDGADPLTTMVFFRPGLIDFVFRSMSLGRTIMSGTISPWPVVKNGSNGHPIKTLQYLLRARGHRRRGRRRVRSPDRSRGEGVSGSQRIGRRRDRRPDDVGGPRRAGQKGQPGRRGQRGAGGVPVPQSVRRPQHRSSRSTGSSDQRPTLPCVVFSKPFRSTFLRWKWTESSAR